MVTCPCGFWGEEVKVGGCTDNEVLRYQKKIYGALLDRIDIQINVPRLKFESLEKAPSNSAKLKGVVRRAREIQTNRFQKAGLKKLTNSELSSKECEELIILTE